MLSGLMPPTGNTSADFGSTARHAFNTGGGSPSAGNIFRPSAPASSDANASVGVATPGKRDHAGTLRFAHDGEIGMRHDDQAAAGVAHARDVGGIANGAGAGEASLPQTAG